MRETSRKIFRERLERMMKDKGINQTELATRTGISMPVISRYLSGQTEPRGSDLMMISVTLGASMDYLYGLDDIKYENWRKGRY